jgi:peptidoglycan/xylan/chitin deacetylase (PgdA/CDA1 family)
MPTLDWLWCGAATPEALESSVRSWRPDVALLLEPSMAPVAIERLPAWALVAVDPRTAAVSDAVAAAMAGRGGWVSAAADSRRGDPPRHCFVAVSAPIYGDDQVRDVKARVEELRRTVAVQGLRALAGRPCLPESRPVLLRPYGRVSVPTRLRLRLRPVTLAMRSLSRPRRLAKDVLALAVIGVFRPIRDMVRTVRGTHPVRVFTFHRVTDLCRDKISISPEAFRRRIAYIARHHDVVDLETALGAIERKQPLHRPLAAITFDDAYRSVFDYARPILAERGLTACCFAATGLVGTDRRFAHDADSPLRPLLEVMDWTELAALRALGWDIGAHTATHQRLSACPPHEYPGEIAAPLAALRDRLGLEHVAIAYPYGGRTDIDGPALDAIVRAGYRACLSNYGGENFSGDGLFDVKRFNIGGAHEPLAWRTRVHGIDLGPLRQWRPRLPVRAGRRST